jgi:hypothetical protein
VFEVVRAEPSGKSSTRHGTSIVTDDLRFELHTPPPEAAPRGSRDPSHDSRGAAARYADPWLFGTVTVTVLRVTLPLPSSAS